MYDAELPSASVIIAFHNEPYSLLVRTVWSVVNSVRRSHRWYSKSNYVVPNTGKTMYVGYHGQNKSSEFVYLKEIILVDDHSTLPDLKNKLDYYVHTRLPQRLIKIIRMIEYSGYTKATSLIRARQAGARHATGDVLVFLDAHCECQRDWLRPLLTRIKQDPSVVVEPIIDSISKKDFSYQEEDTNNFEIGGFLFEGFYTKFKMPQRIKTKRYSMVAPVRTPTMQGGLFAIDRRYYWELGGYDEKMSGWGAENLEMSFRLWQCGGSLEIIPCSRVGHVYRVDNKQFQGPHWYKTNAINMARVAEVWMDEYAELFYLFSANIRKIMLKDKTVIGDLSERKILRDKLQCKTFAWYLDHIYPEKFIPTRDVQAYGRFRNIKSNLCIDELSGELGKFVGLYPCHHDIMKSQMFSLTLKGELRTESSCLKLSMSGNTNKSEGRVILSKCRDKIPRRQMWEFRPTGEIRRVGSHHCLTSSKHKRPLLKVIKCRNNDSHQKWEADYTREKQFRLKKGKLTPQELRFKAIREHNMEIDYT